MTSEQSAQEKAYGAPEEPTEQRNEARGAMSTALFILQILLLAGSLGARATQAKQAKPHTVTPAVPSGEELYQRHCAVCHGNDLKGNGPAPPPFREETPDLTTLALRYKGFPDAYISHVLHNGVKLPAHGPAEMPIWGSTFREADKLGEEAVAQRITNLVNYIKSRQQK